MNKLESFEVLASEFIEAHPGAFLTICALFGTVVGVALQVSQNRLIARGIARELKKLG